MRSVVVFCFLLAFAWQGLLGQTKTELQKERQRIELQIKQINKSLAKSKNKKKSVLDKVQTLNQRINATESLVKINNRETNMLTREINANAQGIDKLRSQLKTLKEEYSLMVVDAYKSKSSQNRIMFLMSSDNFFQAYKRLQYMKQFANHREQQGEDIKTQTLQLQKLNAKLIDQRASKEKLLVKNRETLKRLNSDRITEQELIASIRKKEGQYAKEINTRQKEISKIDQLIQKMIREAIAAENKKLGSTSKSRFKMTPEATAQGSKFEDNKGKLLWPVKSGFVSRPYGTRAHSVVKTVKTKSDGVHIDTEKGAEARVVFDGIVSKVIVIPNANRVVMVRHGQYITVYKNIDKLYIKEGDKVKRNQLIGSIGEDRNDGSTTLGFYIYKNNSTQNPADWVYKM